MKKQLLIATLASVVAASSFEGAAAGQIGSRQTTQDRPGQAATSITGRVANENGQPLQNARVFVNGYGRQAMRQTAMTDEAGKFVVDGLPRGPYVVAVQAPGYVQYRDPLDPVRNRPGDFINVVLKKGGVITGTVTDSNGEPVVGMPMSATLVRDERGRRAGTAYGGSRFTDDRGVYRLFGLPAGTYIVAAGARNFGSQIQTPYGDDAPTYYPSSTRDAAAEVSVQYGSELSGIDIQYRGEPGHAISGSVSDPSLPDAQAAGIGVTLVRASTDAPEAGASVQQRDGARVFAFYGVPDGDYYLTASRGPYQGDDGAASKRVPVKVRGRDFTGVAITLSPMGSMAGRVTLDLATRSARCETPQPPSVEEVLISLSTDDVEGPDPSSRFASSPVPAENNGDFLVQGLPAARYRLDSRGMLDEAWYVRALTIPGPANKPVEAGQAGVLLGAGQRISGVRVVLGEGAALIRGRVVAEKKGAPLPDRLRVHLVPSEPDATSDTLRYFETEIQSDGTFKLTNLAPGHYWMIARPLSEARSNERIPRPLAWNATARSALRREAEAASNAIELKPCQRLTDQVLRYAEPKETQAPKRK